VVPGQSHRQMQWWCWGRVIGKGSGGIGAEAKAEGHQRQWQGQRQRRGRIFIILQWQFHELFYHINVCFNNRKT